MVMPERMPAKNPFILLTLMWLVAFLQVFWDASRSVYRVSELERYCITNVLMCSTLTYSIFKGR